MNSLDTIKILGSLLGNGSLSRGSGSSVLTNILSSALSGGGRQQSGGGLGDILGGLLGGAQQQRQQPSGGGLGDILGSLLGGAGGAQMQQQQQQGGGLGDLLGSLLGGTGQAAPSQGGAGGLGGLLGAALGKHAQASMPEEKIDWLSQLQGTKEEEALTQAEILIRAMVNSAKADGRVDDAEKQKIVGQLNDVTQEEIDFVKAELDAPLDLDGFIKSIPANMAQHVYIVSLMSIDLDNRAEAEYLVKLARGLKVDAKVANQLHTELGLPTLFT